MCGVGRITAHGRTQEGPYENISSSPLVIQMEKLRSRDEEACSGSHRKVGCLGTEAVKIRCSQFFYLKGFDKYPTMDNVPTRQVRVGLVRNISPNLKERINPRYLGGSVGEGGVVVVTSCVSKIQAQKLLESDT